MVFVVFLRGLRGVVVFEPRRWFWTIYRVVLWRLLFSFFDIVLHLVFDSGARLALHRRAQIDADAGVRRSRLRAVGTEHDRLGHDRQRRHRLRRAL